MLLMPRYSFDFSAKRRHASGFSLVEVLVVLAIIAILTAAAVPAISSTMRAYQLETTSQTVVNQLSLARQNALSINQCVEVRFYYLPDYNQPVSATPAVYRAMQCFSQGAPNASGTSVLTPLTKPCFFPAPIIVSMAISPNPVSPLLSTSPATPATTDLSLPVYGSNYRYSSFQFKPNGSAGSLSSTSNSMTLVIQNDALGSTGLPKNYVTLQVDPLVGTVRAFRP